MRVSAVQFAASTDLDANAATITRRVAGAAAAGAELVVLPEASMYDFGPPDSDLGPVAQAVDGPFVASLSELARTHQVGLVAGMFETSHEPDRPFNTLVVLDAGGDLLTSYRKAHLYDSFGYRESDRLLAGATAVSSFSCGGLTVGLMTCYDLRFPEVARALVDDGAEVIVVPSAWVRGPLKEDHWATLLRARAIENTLYVAGAAQTGKHYCGCSMVVDPMGVVLAALGDEEGVVTAELDASRVASVRRHNPSLANRRLVRP